MIANGRKQIYVIFSICLVVFIILYINQGVYSDSLSKLFSPPGQNDLKEKILTTAKGSVSYYVLNEEVFKPNGFEIIVGSEPIPILKNINPKSCEEIFTSWLDIALKSESPSSPPKILPADFVEDFTLRGHAVLSEAYYNNMAQSKSKIWEQIPEWLGKDPLTFSNYGAEGSEMNSNFELFLVSVANAVRYMNITGLDGVVIGSEQPWVEVISLQNGAKSLLTVEYQETTILGEQRVKWIHPFDFARQWKDQNQFDFAISFSSIEHSGLQRYGDPRDPIGDIREIQKVRCILKKGGIFFLGLPRGQDQLVYNAHRIYGRIRLAMMFDGFELLHVFRNTNPLPFKLANEDFARVLQSDKTNIQDTFVLRKL